MFNLSVALWCLYLLRGGVGWQTTPPPSSFQPSNIYEILMGSNSGGKKFHSLQYFRYLWTSFHILIHQRTFKTKPKHLLLKYF